MRRDFNLIVHAYNHSYALLFASVLYLAEEVSLLLSVREAGQVAHDHQVSVIQHCIEPAPGGQQGLHAKDTLFTALDYMHKVVAKIQLFGFAGKN